MPIRPFRTGKKPENWYGSVKIGKTEKPNRTVCSLTKICRETSIALFEVLKDEYLKPPTPEQWRRNAVEFSQIWNSPNTVGAIDRKHVSIQCPPNSGSDYYNYKKYFSLVLMASCNARLLFDWIDIGAYGKEGDSSVFASSTMAAALENNTLCLPGYSNLVYSDPPVKTPNFFVADEAFPLKPYIMKPYPGRLTGLVTEH